MKKKNEFKKIDMKHVIAIFVTIMLFGLYTIPAYVMLENPEFAGIGGLYVPLVLFTLLWGRMLGKEYFNMTHV